MNKIKITSVKIEDLFSFMIYLKINEMFIIEYKYTQEDVEPHSILLKTGTLTSNSFKRRLKRFEMGNNSKITTHFL